MNIKGHSGFPIELVSGSILRKSAHGPASRRLKAQIEKQVCFEKSAKFARISSPRVLSVLDDGVDHFQADMEFVPAADFVEFLSHATREALDYFSGVIAEYIGANVSESTSGDARPAVSRKLEELAAKQVPSRFLEAAAGMLQHEVVIPLGPCHGDLSLANILFKRYELCFIDFLDPFLESPLLDLVKLRQDTRHHWSLQLYTGDCDRVKLSSALRYVDRKIDQLYAQAPWYRTHYRLFQLVNFMRILPYCRESSIERQTIACLDQLLREENPAQS